MYQSGGVGGRVSKLKFIDQDRGVANYSKLGKEKWILSIQQNFTWNKNLQSCFIYCYGTYLADYNELFLLLWILGE